jgi:hypothetical protein
MIKLDKENNVFINNEQIGHVDEFLKCAAWNIMKFCRPATGGERT